MKESNKRHYESKLKSKPCSKEQRLKFLAFYVDRDKNRKQHVGGGKGRDVNGIVKAIRRSFYRKNIKLMLKAS